MLRGVILQNFMSYSNAYIPLKPGVNVICGPNGAGKSSILLAISIALGQSYTERSRRLMDLIRWGEKVARVSVQIDNSPHEGRRPLAGWNIDSVTLTRILRNDGRYPFLIQGRLASKEEVEDLLNKISLNPDNMLIIMHQHMVERFGVVSPKEKLLMVEEAVGFKSYREDVLEAQNRLNKVLGEERSIKALLESAKETLDHWSVEYQRYLRKKELEGRRKQLELELAWSAVARREHNLKRLEERLGRKEAEMALIKARIEKYQSQVDKLQRELDRVEGLEAELGSKVLELEGRKVRFEVDIEWCESLAKETSASLRLVEGLAEEGFTLLGKLEGLVNGFKEEAGVKDYLRKLRRFYEALIEGVVKDYYRRRGSLEERLKTSRGRLEAIAKNLGEVQEKLNGLRVEVKERRARFFEFKSRLESLKDREGDVGRELKDIGVEVEAAREDLKPFLEKAEKLGPRPLTVRGVEEVSTELGVVNGRLESLANVSEDVEKMYKSYEALHAELEGKIGEVARNREELLLEVKKRTDNWRKVIKELLSEVNQRYQLIFSSIGASGEVKLVNEEDVEEAGLELLVGFKGGKPTTLDSYTQSGGERSLSIMAFLLALQQHVKSPFRAIDEYDVHMDPKNRELVSNLIVSAVRAAGSGQYLVITPSQVIAEKDVGVITVQNVEGRSKVSEVAP